MNIIMTNHRNTQKATLSCINLKLELNEMVQIIKEKNKIERKNEPLYIDDCGL